MHSIRSKTILLNVVAIVIAMLAATIISAISVANIGHNNSEKILVLSCETGKNSLNYYFKSVEQSVETVSTIIEADLAKTNEADFVSHINRSYDFFSEAVSHTNGVLTYYYRIDPVISDQYTDKQAEGYFYEKYTNSDKYTSFPVTDLHERTDGTEWFFDYKPDVNPGRNAKWLPPYITANLNAYVVSYNTPIFKGNTFYGVIGIEISYSTLGEQINDIKVLKSGFAFIVDQKSAKLIYHPDVNLMNSKEEDRPDIPASLIRGLANDEHHVEYTYPAPNGTVKHAYWLSLSNEMCIVVAVPLSEVNSTWIRVVIEIVIAAVIIIGLFVAISIMFSRHFTKPLKDLTEAAEQINKGNYNVKLDYKGNDEIGVLTTTVNRLIEHLKGYISDLNSLAYADALTSVRNKSAFDICTRELQERMNSTNNKPEFAIAMFDCDYLKEVNDHYGHDKGDVYLKNSCHLICRVFQNSPVFRVGGDEFAIILQGEDYRHKESLRRFFIEKSAEICAFAKEPWEEIRVAIGVATYDKNIDQNIDDVVIRADHLMYENKRDRKINGAPLIKEKK